MYFRRRMFLECRSDTLTSPTSNTHALLTFMIRKSQESHCLSQQLRPLCASQRGRALGGGPLHAPSAAASATRAATRARAAAARSALEDATASALAPPPSPPPPPCREGRGLAEGRLVVTVVSTVCVGPSGLLRLGIGLLASVVCIVKVLLCCCRRLYFRHKCTYASPGSSSES